MTYRFEATASLLGPWIKEAATDTEFRTIVRLGALIDEGLRYNHAVLTTTLLSIEQRQYDEIHCRLNPEQQRDLEVAIARWAYDEWCKFHNCPGLE